MDSNQETPVRVDSPSPPEAQTCSLESADAAPGASQSTSDDDAEANNKKVNNSTGTDSELSNQSMIRKTDLFRQTIRARDLQRLGPV